MKGYESEEALKEVLARGHVRIKGEPQKPYLGPPLKNTIPFGPWKPCEKGIPHCASRIGVKGIIRQSSQGMNKTETRFETDYMKPMRHAGEIGEYRFEAITLKLGNGLRYTPDFSATNAAGKLVFWEIKGARIEEDAIVKFKMAPTIFPEYEFYLCQWKGGEWVIQKGLA